MGANFVPGTPWPVTWTCDVTSESAAVTGGAVSAASFVLWAMSGMRFGTTSVKLRPCRRTCRPTVFPGAVWDPWPGVGFGPLFGGYGPATWGVIGASCPSCMDNCSCTILPELVLPAPINSIVEVKVDGVVLPSTAYRPDNNRLLVRLDGQAWPRCQNLLLDDTQPGTYSVTALIGEDVPDMASWAVGELACQFIRAKRGEDCQLPPNVTSLARQGVTITLPDLTAVIEKGRLGLRFGDLFLRSVNPAGLTQRARVYSVDDVLSRRVGT